MSKNREIEAKTILSKEVYQKLCAAYPVKNDFVQENYYFDTPSWVLKDHNIGLRIRIYSDHAEQTMKVPDTRPLQKKFHEVIEINDDLSLNEAKYFVEQAKNNQEFIFSGNIGSYLDEHFKNEKTKLNLFTWSKTRRILANGPEDCELTLDYTQYPDGYEDYELEIENTDPELIKKFSFNWKIIFHLRKPKKILTKIRLPAL